MKNILLISTILILFTACSQHVKKEYSEKYNSSGIYSLSVENREGSIIIKRWKKDYIDIKVIKNSWNGKKEFDKTEEIIDLKEEMNIKTVYKDENAKIKVDYIIKMPVSVKVGRVLGENGDIIISSLKGDMSLISSNGDIICENITGLINAETSNGNIEIKNSTTIKNLISSNGNISFDFNDIFSEKSLVKTSNGDISISIKNDTRIHLMGRTANGEIKTDIKDVKKNIQGKEIDINFLESDKQIYLKTSNGDINILKIK